MQRAETRASITCLLFLRKIETKIKVENRALIPQIQEWPSGSLKELWEKTCLLSRGEMPQNLHGKDRPKLTFIHPPTHLFTTYAWGWMVDVSPAFLEPKFQQQKQTGPLRVGLDEAEEGFLWRQHLSWPVRVHENTQQEVRGQPSWQKEQLVHRLGWTDSTLYPRIACFYSGAGGGGRALTGRSRQPSWEGSLV